VPGALAPNPNATQPRPPPRPPRETRTIDLGGDLYGNEADDFAASVLDGAPPRVSFAARPHWTAPDRSASSRWTRFRGVSCT
jgi:hypothetical protein